LVRYWFWPIKKRICSDVWLHCLVLDGVYRRSDESAPQFVEVAAPTDEALQAVLTVQGAMPRQTEFKQTLCAGINGNRVARSRALRGR
jgi:hypothetical protein